VVLIGLVSVACRAERLPLPTDKPAGKADTQVTPSTSTASSDQLVDTSTPSPEPLPERLLTICLGREPRSLFVFEATSLVAQNVLAAVYDGPFDLHQFVAQPVILERMPSLENGEAILQPAQVERGAAIVDAYGNLARLEAGVMYRPSGCVEANCAQAYIGDQAALLDQLVLRFRLKAGLLWSDGMSLTAGDSVYAFEIAQALYPAVFPDLVDRTQTYQAIDDLTAEWVGLPGYQDGLYHPKFFIPLPRHAWEEIPPVELRTAEVSARKPLGWGPYVIDEWVAGDQISLHKNPLYFRSDENLPRFDRLVFRFTGTEEEALAALLDGKCDLVDQSVGLDEGTQQVQELQQAGRLLVISQTATAWELIAFGITSSQEETPNLAGQKEVRQAIAGCIDRQAIAEIYGSPSLVADAYPTHAPAL
jgi:peptide/nickel transport system substrate-binding protein